MRIVLVFLFFALGINTSVSQEKKNKQPDVYGWYFRAVSGYPVSVTFKPIVFFKDGAYFEVKAKPIEDIDNSDSKITQPELWGTWKKTDSIFILKNNEGKLKEYNLNKKNWFPAFPFNTSIRLRGTYEKISGGDFGNGLYALFNTQLTFLDNTHFTHSEKNIVSSYNSQAWKDSTDSGTYSIKGHTIEFKYNDGKVVRFSFAIGAKGKNMIDTDMIFIGGKAYVIE